MGNNGETVHYARRVRRADNMILQTKHIFKRNLIWLNKKSILYTFVISVFFVLFLLAHSSELSYSNGLISTNKVQMKYPIAKFHQKLVTQARRPSNRLKFILLWTNPNASPFIYFGRGQSVFKNKSCRYTNCYVTGDKNYLGNYVLFDAILFNGPQLSLNMLPENCPVRRSPHQKYIYANIESSANYPICTKVWNGFFNWTWTYRLDSDGIWGYFAVKNATNAVVAPKLDAQWIDVDRMDDIGKDLKEKLSTKTIPVAWFSSNCETQSKREKIVSKLRTYLKNYSLNIHVYGSCGDHKCPRSINDRCLELLEKKYYFYLAFENALSIDYVTEKILYAYRHNTVPVVYGGANYSRFLPTGSYLDAYEMGPERLARKMNELITNPPEYHKFFRWQKYYSFHYRHESPETDDYCKFCALLNDEGLVSKTSVVDDLEWWWNGNSSCFKRHHTISDFDYVYEGVE